MRVARRVGLVAKKKGTKCNAGTGRTDRSMLSRPKKGAVNGTERTSQMFYFRAHGRLVASASGKQPESGEIRCSHILGSTRFNIF